MPTTLARSRPVAGKGRLPQGLLRDRPVGNYARPSAEPGLALFHGQKRYSLADAADCRRQANAAVANNGHDPGVPTERFELEDAEVTVLNHVIFALSERDDFEHLVPDAADRQAVHNLLALLEREDPAVFSADYDKRLEQARRQVLPDTD